MENKNLSPSFISLCITIPVPTILSDFKKSSFANFRNLAFSKLSNISEILLFSFFFIINANNNSKSITNHKIIGIANFIRTDDTGLIGKSGNSFTNSISLRYSLYPPNKIYMVSSINKKNSV